MEFFSKEIYKNNIKGNVAELGVYQGDFAKYINILFPDRKLYLFDTFKGFNENDVNVEIKKIYFDAETGRFSNTSVDIVMSKMKYPDNCEIINGYFPDSLQKYEVISDFSFVSIDADLYNPILAGLEFFYPKLTRGGYIMIHDYNFSRYSKSVKSAVDDFHKITPICRVPIFDFGGSVIITK